MKAKALFLDCGGVMVCPPTGDWTLTNKMLPVLGADFFEKHLEEYRQARKCADQYIPDGYLMDDELPECTMMERFYRLTFAAMGRHLSDEEYAFLVECQRSVTKYRFFDDVKPFLAAWQGKIRLGVISDAPPSTRRILREEGVAQYMDGMTFSFELGTLKPDPRMYRHMLEMIGVAPEDAVFVDDMPRNLFGAQAVGMQAVQMIRPMPAAYPMDAQWDGPAAHDFAELGRLLEL